MANLAPTAVPTASVGKHPVGVTTLRVNDADRHRSLDVELWYPATAPEGGQPVVYDVEAAAMTVARIRSAVGAHRDVQARPGQWPVVLLSHGAGSSRYGNVGLAEVLASHGYVVAAPDHAGHTVADKVFGISDDDRAQSALDRPLDLSRVLDALEARSGDVDHLLSGRVDIDRVAVAGHSFGGRAALGLVGARFDAVRQQNECRGDDDDRRCRALAVFGDKPYRYRDARIKAALLITPAGYRFYRADGIAQVDAPVLIVGARQDRTTPFDQFQRTVYDGLHGPRYLLELKRAGHLTATDVCQIVDSVGFFARAVGGDRAVDGCGPEFLSSETALELVVDATLPFFDLYLNENTVAEKRLRHAIDPLRISLR